jgi:hypothetical protein
MEEFRSAYKFLVGKLEWKRPLEIPVSKKIILKWI